MIKVRLRALPDKIEGIIEILQKNVEVLKISTPAPDRGTPYVRVYVEVEEKNNE